MRPTAILVGSDVMAIGALQAAAWPPLRVPEDISIVGFDGISFVGFDGISFSALATPSLTTVVQPTYRPGRLAASQFSGGVAGSSPVRVAHPFEPTLEVRGMTAVAP